MSSDESPWAFAYQLSSKNGAHMNFPASRGLLSPSPFATTSRGRRAFCHRLVTPEKKINIALTKYATGSPAADVMVSLGMVPAGRRSAGARDQGVNRSEHVCALGYKLWKVQALHMIDVGKPDQKLSSSELTATVRPWMSLFASRMPRTYGVTIEGSF
jgi:hypothetical protein